MESFVWLAALASTTSSVLAEAGSEGGFGLNLNILETNLINLSVLIAVLIYFGRQILPKTLSDRQSAISAAIQDVEQRSQAAGIALQEQQQNLKQAQSEAEQIRANAVESAQVARQAILAQAQEDVRRLKESASQDLNSARDRAIAELRQRVIAMAMEQAEAQLKDGMNESTQHQLIERSIALMGGAK